MRTVVAVVLMVHGLSHAGPSMWARGPEWVVTPLWLIATSCFLLAGFRLLQLDLVPLPTKTMVLIGAGASLALLTMLDHPLTYPGVAIDALLLAVAARWPALDTPRTSSSTHRLRHAIAVALSAVFVTYVCAVIALRPWYIRWGTTSEDRTVPLFGDSLSPGARYILNHAVTIQAPADSVWPWVAQIGQDRGGFYSYERFEDLVGARVTNAESIVPEWQRRAVGDFVRAVPPDWFGGLFGPNVGWRVTALDPGRALVLEKWGAFVVRPIDDRTSRMHIRQLNPGTPSVMGLVFGSAGLLVFEPAHFIMQRKMLLGIKKRAEHRQS